MTLKNKKLQELNNLLDLVSSELNTDFMVITSQVNSLEVTPTERSSLDWSVAHFKRNLVDMHITIKNMQDRLRIIDK